MKLRLTSSSLMLAISICFLAASAQAQPRTPQLPTPPPMRFVAREDRSQLSNARDPKARIRITIELADARLARIEALTTQKQFEQASEAVGAYLGLIEDVMSYIPRLTNINRTTTQDLYRKLDIALRGQIPRLVVARRMTPSDYAIHIKTAEEFVRDTRTAALDYFYGYSILREKDKSETKADAAKDPSQDDKVP
jgi:hypothetical protein